MRRNKKAGLAQTLTRRYIYQQKTSTRVFAFGILYFGMFLCRSWGCFMDSILLCVGQTKARTKVPKAKQGFPKVAVLMYAEIVRCLQDNADTINKFSPTLNGVRARVSKLG